MCGRPDDSWKGPANPSRPAAVQPAAGRTARRLLYHPCIHARRSSIDPHDRGSHPPSAPSPPLSAFSNGQDTNTPTDGNRFNLGHLSNDFEVHQEAFCLTHLQDSTNVQRLELVEIVDGVFESGCGAGSLRGSHGRINTPSPVVKIPATHAVISVASVAAKSARRPRLPNSSRRDGVRAAIPPTKMATEATWAKPQSA